MTVMSSARAITRACLRPDSPALRAAPRVVRRRHRARAGPRRGLRDRCGRVALRHGGRLRRLGCGRSLDVERRLRCMRGRSGALPAPVRPRHASPRRWTASAMLADAGTACSAAPVAHAALGDFPRPAAVFDADRARVRRKRRRRPHSGRSRARAVRRDRAPRHLRGNRRQPTRAERDRRGPGRPVGAPVPECACSPGTTPKPSTTVSTERSGRGSF